MRTDRWPRVLGKDERAVSDVLATALLVGLTVLLTAGFSAFLIAAAPAASKTIVADLELRLDAGGCAWGEGDEAVLLRHLGGEPLHRNNLRITVVTTTQQLEWAGGQLSGAAFADGVFAAGERWRSDGLTLADGNVVLVDITEDGAAGTLTHQAQLRAGGDPCAT